MEITTLAERMKEFIETELGLYVEVRHNGKGYSFYPITPTGRIIGETRLSTLTHSANPVVFVNSRGYFTSIGGMALASRFRALLEAESNPVPKEDVLELTPDMRVDLGEVVDFANAQKMAESLN